MVSSQAMSRAAKLTRDGYLSRAARALEDQHSAPSDEPTWRGLMQRHPDARGPRRYNEPRRKQERKRNRIRGMRLSNGGRILRPHMSPLFLSPLKQAGCGDPRRRHSSRKLPSTTTTTSVTSIGTIGTPLSSRLSGAPNLQCLWHVSVGGLDLMQLSATCQNACKPIHMMK